MQRREFLKRSAAALTMASVTKGRALGESTPKQPNVVFFLTDEWRGQALGYAGDPNAKTPTLDALAAEGINCATCISGLPLCCPARASLMTGQYPLTNGVFINDVPLVPKGVTLAEAFQKTG